jgi:hypothetical protein
MKKNLLVLLFVFIYALGSAQVVFYVQPPSDLSGNYDLSYSTEANGWGGADLEDPANAVVGELAFAYDGSDADSLCCEQPIVNDVDGKIAVVYRGACQFGTKAIGVQNAGAIACVIISNSSDPLIGILGGDSGLNVTIPTILIEMATGAALRDQILAGGLTAFIGNKNGYYGNDLGIEPGDVIRAPRSSNILLLAQDETEFDASVGSWVRNYGFNDQTNVILSATVEHDGALLYEESSEAFDLVSGDSAFVYLPNFAQSSYDLGEYSFTYSVASDSTDDFSADNSFAPNFQMTENLYSYATFADGEVNKVQFFRPSEISGTVQQCVAFQDANASRVGVEGLTFSASTDGETMDGEVIDIFAYEWAVEFVDINDENYLGVDESDFDLLASGSYEYIGNDLESQDVYASFDDVIYLEDDVRYLFCIAYDSDQLFTGFDAANVDYRTTLDEYLQPQFPNTSGTDWFLVGFGTDVTPSIVVHMFDANASGVEEVVNTVDVTPYPNPAVEFIEIPMNDISGLTTVNIYDLNGKLVESQSVNTVKGTNLRVDVSNLVGGMYSFDLRYESGNVSKFNVVITK